MILPQVQSLIDEVNKDKKRGYQPDNGYNYRELKGWLSALENELNYFNNSIGKIYLLCGDRIDTIYETIAAIKGALGQ